MNNNNHSEPSGGLKLCDVYFVLFRQKWIIILFSLGGLIATAILLLFIAPPQYRSQTKLLIKYVNDSKTPLPPGDAEATKALDDRPASLLNTEILILTSLDLGRDVVASVGAKKILAKAGGGKDPSKAAALVIKNLEIEPISGGNVLDISFQHPDTNVTLEVLNQVIICYYKKHREMHQPIQISDFLIKETEQLRGKVAQLDQQIRRAKSNTGVIFPDVAQKAYAEQMFQIREKIDGAEAELAEHQTTLRLVTPATEGSPKSPRPRPEIPLDQINEYKGLSARVDFFSKREQELLTQFTKESTFVREVRQQVAQAEKEKNTLELQYPYLPLLLIAPTGTSAATSAGTNPVNPAQESARILALQAKIGTLNTQLTRVRTEATDVENTLATIAELQSSKALAENDLKYFSADLEQSRIKAAMGSQTAPNISVIESPTPPVKNWSKTFKKRMTLTAAGGIAAGLALAFFTELTLDNSVKRPGEIETKLRLPLLISIPYASRNGRSKNLLRWKKPVNGSELNNVQGAPGDARRPETQLLNRYYTGLRDRLLVYFDVHNVSRKPKLVAVTSCHSGAGVTSIAAGLAASLSETGDGNVLLVEMKPEQQVMQEFHKGKLTCGLAGALEPGTKEIALVQEKLYVVTERTYSEKQFRNLPKRFCELVPKLKASDYDYIIFDMPPVNQTSITPRLAGLMDMVLLVIESEKTKQDVVRRVNSLLLESKANVTTVFNKTRNYIPVQLHQEYLNEV